MSLTDDILIERYLKGELSKEEEVDFSQRLSTEPEFKEKVLLEKQLLETLNEEDWSFAESGNSPELEGYKALFESDEIQGIKKTITTANENYKSSKQGKLRRLLLYPVAAAAVFILIFFGLKPSHLSTQELFISYLEKSDIQTLTTRGSEQMDQDLSNAQGYFDQQEHENAVASYSKVLENGYSHSVVYINLALSQMQLKQFEHAEQTLDKLIQSDLLDAEKGYWYKSLLYLRKEAIDETKKTLKMIIDNKYYNHMLAKELLKKVN